MKAGWAAIALCLSSGAAQAQSLDALAEHLDLLRNTCKFALPNHPLGNVISSVREDAAKGWSRLTFGVELTAKGLTSSGRLTFTCKLDQGAAAVKEQSHRAGAEANDRHPVMTPRQLIQAEDAGGRYFRHVAWERPVNGVNWVANVAYSDYTFGDGQKSKTSFYLICHAKIAIPCIEFQDSDSKQPGGIGTSALLGFVKGIAYLDSTER